MQPRKGTSLGGTACFGVFCVKIRPGPLAVASCKNPKKTKKLTRVWCAKSRMRRDETPGRIVTNFCTGVGVHDVITCTDLYYDRLWGLGVAEVKFWLSPLTCFVTLTTLSHYRASVWLTVAWSSTICAGFRYTCNAVWQWLRLTPVQISNPSVQPFCHSGMTKQLMTSATSCSTISVHMHSNVQAKMC